MKSEKIFFIADAKSIHTVKWVDYFIDKDYDVYLATFANVNNTKCKNIHFLSKTTSSSKGGNYYYLFSIFKLAKLLKKIAPKYINAHYSYSYGLVATLARAYSTMDTELSIVCHGSDILAPPNKFIFKKINKYALCKADKIFVVSNQIKDKVEEFGINLDKVFVGQYGVDIVSLKKNKDIDILSNRAYSSNSQIDFLLEAIDSVNYKNLNIVFVLPNIKEKDYVRLQKRYSYIKFYKHIEYNKMINLLGRAKVYISATKSDGTPLSLLEAMSLECFPVVSNIVANRSWILDGVNGYMFNNEKDFLSKLEQVINSKNNIESIEINKKMILGKGTYSKQMKKIENFMNQKLEDI